jgi:ribosome-binding factor A
VRDKGLIVASRRPGARKAPSGKPASQRQLRVGEMLRGALSEILTRGDIRDPALQGAIITVSEVRVTPDLLNAVVYVVPLGHPDPPSIVDALTRAKKYVRGELARTVRMKFMPDLTFAADTTFDYAESVANILNSPGVARDLKDDEPDDGDEGSRD